MEKAPEIKNPLLETYGAVVDSYFSPEKKVDEPIFMFPGVASASQVDELPYKPDLVYFDPGEAQLESIQKSVENLRGTLESEKQGARTTGNQKRKFNDIADRVRAVRGQAEGIQQLSFHLDAFRHALKTGDEALLAGNPFYALTKLIFKHNITRAVFLLDHLQEELASNAPDKVQTARTLREIWGGPGTTRNIPAKLKESIGAFFGLSRVFLGIFLFLISSFTTHRAVSALLHLPSIHTLFGRYFTEGQIELLQFTLAALGGFLLTIIVWDLKARLCRGIAETGAVFSGIRAAFLIHPRWMLLALLLALLSVKANYDSVSVILSKKEHLSQQREQIRNKVALALGTPETVDLTNPQSLHDIQGVLNAISVYVSEQFALIPEAELTGRDPRKGPRYWGKRFIVYGGFEPGVNDVAHAFRNVRFARNMDQKLQQSGVVLDIPFAEKLAAIAHKQALDLAKTSETIQRHLLALDHLMQVGSLSPGTIRKILTFDNKQVNLHIQEIAKALDANQKMFWTIIREMDELTALYISVLAQVDRKSDAAFANLRVRSHVPALKLPLIDAIQSESVQTSNQKSFQELVTFLEERYGGFNGKGLMLLILFLSFAFDFLPMLLFSRGTTRQGMADAQIFPELLQYLKDWEDAFIDLSKSFFYRPAVQQVFRGLTFPNETGVRNAFFRLLEEINTEVKDVKDLRAMEQRRAWIYSLFFPTRTLNISGYNARVNAIETLLSRKEIYFPRLIKSLFPGLPYETKSEKLLDEETFLQFYQKTETGQAQDKERFSAELRKVGRGDLVSEDPDTAEGREEPGLLATVGLQISGALRRIKLPTPSRKKNEVDQWTVMIQQAATSKPVPSTTSQTPTATGEENESDEPQALWYILCKKGWMEPFPPFAYTRRNWLIDLSSVDEKSLEDLDTLHDFIPDFVKMLKKVLTNTLPVIQESLDPLEDICTRFPEQCAAQGIVITSELKNRFKEIEKESLGMWGACVSHLLGEEAALNAQFGKTDASNLAGVLAEGGDISQFYDRIHTLMSDARASAQQAKTIEEITVNSIKNSVGEIKVLCDDVNQMLVKINILSLELRKKRPLPHAKLRGLNEGSALLERAPREARAILDAREKVLARSKQDLFTDKNHDELSELKSQAQALHSRVDNILNLVDK